MSVRAGEWCAWSCASVCASARAGVCSCAKCPEESREAGGRGEMDVEVGVLEWSEGWGVLGGARRHGHRASLVPLSGLYSAAPFMVSLQICRPLGSTLYN